LNKNYSDLWAVDVVCFLALEHRRVSFGMIFLLSELRKMNYLSINQFNMFRTNLMLQLKINHRLANIVVIDRF
jgi:hypothetical protein